MPLKVELNNAAGTAQEIVAVAIKLGIDPILAVSDGYVETGLNRFAIGDFENGVGTSFGVFQLHLGGELNSLPGNLQQQIQAAYDPTICAQVALAVFVTTQKENPGMSPGWIAATSQRPFDAEAYAAEVNSIYSNTVHNVGDVAEVLQQAYGANWQEVIDKKPLFTQLAMEDEMIVENSKDGAVVSVSGNTTTGLTQHALQQILSAHEAANVPLVVVKDDMQDPDIGIWATVHQSGYKILPAVGDSGTATDVPSDTGSK